MHEKRGPRPSRGAPKAAKSARGRAGEAKGVQNGAQSLQNGAQSDPKIEKTRVSWTLSSILYLPYGTHIGGPGWQPQSVKSASFFPARPREGSGETFLAPKLSKGSKMGAQRDPRGAPGGPRETTGRPKGVKMTSKIDPKRETATFNSEAGSFFDVFEAKSFFDFV